MKPAFPDISPPKKYRHTQFAESRTKPSNNKTKLLIFRTLFLLYYFNVTLSYETLFYTCEMVQGAI